jgi:hypothetical protein
MLKTNPVKDIMGEVVGKIRLLYQREIESSKMGFIRFKSIAISWDATIE